jgi:hypothetical protein
VREQADAFGLDATGTEPQDSFLAHSDGPQYRVPRVVFEQARAIYQVGAGLNAAGGNRELHRR